MMSDGSTFIRLTASWSGNKYALELPPDTTVQDLKEKLSQLTDVLPTKQKLMGLVKGKLPADDTLLSELPLRPNHTFMMMGTPEADIFQDLPADARPTLVDDFEDIELDVQAVTSAANNERNQRKLREYIDKTTIHLINPIRPGRKLLVLDIDYTIYDMKSTASNIQQLMRPGLHEFLTAISKVYEVAYWSQTHWRYLEAKLTEMSLLTHDNFRVCFVLDKSSMPSIVTTRKGKAYKHQVKPLELIWSKLPEFSAKNTLHVDDLSRNFAMNYRNGIKISAFKKSHETRTSDRELWYLTKYLLWVAQFDDLSARDHSQWRSKAAELELSDVPAEFLPDTL